MVSGTVEVTNGEVVRLFTEISPPISPWTQCTGSKIPVLFHWFLLRYRLGLIWARRTLCVLPMFTGGKVSTTSGALSVRLMVRVVDNGWFVGYFPYFFAGNMGCLSS